MESPIIISQPRDGVGLIQLNRPDRLNALNTPTMNAISNTLTAFAADDGVRCIVLTGNERAFAAGSDVTEMQGVSAPEARQTGTHRFAQWEQIRTYPKPLIAAVNGWCLGGGNELAMSCDMLLAGENAKFGQPEINLAIMPGAGGTQRLTRAVGKAVAMEMVLAGRFITAHEALTLGLANAVHPPELTLEHALDLAEVVAGQAPIAARLAKEAVLKAFEMPLSEGLRYERSNFYTLFDTDDKEEGIAAFLEKRDPDWKGH